MVGRKRGHQSCGTQPWVSIVYLQRLKTEVHAVHPHSTPGLPHTVRPHLLTNNAHPCPPDVDCALATKSLLVTPKATVDAATALSALSPTLNAGCPVPRLADTALLEPQLSAELSWQ